VRKRSFGRCGQSRKGRRALNNDYFVLRGALHSRRQTRSLTGAGIRSVFFGRLPAFAVWMTHTSGSFRNSLCTVSTDSFHSAAISLTVRTSSISYSVDAPWISRFRDVKTIRRSALPARRGFSPWPTRFETHAITLVTGLPFTDFFLPVCCLA